MSRKKNISDLQFRRELIKDIAIGADYVHRKSNYYDHIRTKYSIEKQRCLRLWDDNYPEVMDEFIEHSMNSAKDKFAEYLALRIDIKQERILTLQEQAKQMIQEINGDVEYYYTIKGNKLVTSHPNGVFTVPVQVKNQIRKQLKEVLAEISKIEGDYAPTKIQGVGAISFTPVPEKT